MKNCESDKHKHDIGRLVVIRRTIYHGKPAPRRVKKPQVPASLFPLEGTGASFSVPAFVLWWYEWASWHHCPDTSRRCLLPIRPVGWGIEVMAEWQGAEPTSTLLWLATFCKCNSNGCRCSVSRTCHSVLGKDSRHVRPGRLWVNRIASEHAHTANGRQDDNGAASVCRCVSASIDLTWPDPDPLGATFAVCVLGNFGSSCVFT